MVCDGKADHQGAFARRLKQGGSRQHDIIHHSHFGSWASPLSAGTNGRRSTLQACIIAVHSSHSSSQRSANVNSSPRRIAWYTAPWRRVNACCSIDLLSSIVSCRGATSNARLPAALRHISSRGCSPHACCLSHSIFWAMPLTQVLSSAIILQTSRSPAGGQQAPLNANHLGRLQTQEGQAKSTYNASRNSSQWDTKVSTIAKDEELDLGTRR